MTKRLQKAHALVRKFARGLVRLEHPFHLSYLGSVTFYYASHEVFTVAGFAGGAFLTVLAHYISQGE